MFMCDCGCERGITESVRSQHRGRLSIFALCEFWPDPVNHQTALVPSHCRKERRNGGCNVSLVVADVMCKTPRCKSVIVTGTRLTFVILPEAFSATKVHPFWAFLFYLFFVLSAIHQQVSPLLPLLCPVHHSPTG